ncbi:MAG TPA: hypothetical protein VLV54_10110 [Thermoanaerobaculia bacterium]|nr:hypothetical protein [Thermoanaerobaculia bacterium]
MRSTMIRLAVLYALLVLGSGFFAAGNAIGCTISKEELQKIPTYRDPWEMLQPTSVPDEFEALQAILLEAETKALCKEVRWDGWKGLTLERALRAASSREEALVEADAVGLLRGFVVLLLQGRSCAEPSPEVLAEAQEYSRRFGLPPRIDFPGDE